MNPYIAADRDKSLQVGSGHPSRSTTCENWSGGSVQLIFGSHFTKNHSVCPIRAQIKMKIIFCAQKQKLYLAKLLATRRGTSLPKRCAWEASLLWILHEACSNGQKAKKSHTWYQILWMTLHPNLCMTGLVFLLGTTWHVMAPSAGFTIFWFFLNRIWLVSNLAQTSGLRHLY